MDDLIDAGDALARRATRLLTDVMNDHETDPDTIQNLRIALAAWRRAASAARNAAEGPADDH